MHHDLCRHLSTEHRIRNSAESGVSSDYTTDSTTTSDSSDSDTDDSTTENDVIVPQVYSRHESPQDLLRPQRRLHRLNILNPDPNSLLDIYHASRSR